MAGSSGTHNTVIITCTITKCASKQNMLFIESKEAKSMPKTCVLLIGNVRGGFARHFVTHKSHVNAQCTAHMRGFKWRGDQLNRYV